MRSAPSTGLEARSAQKLADVLQASFWHLFAAMAVLSAFHWSSIDWLLSKLLGPVATPRLIMVTPAMESSLIVARFRCQLRLVSSRALRCSVLGREASLREFLHFNRLHLGL